jgi:hypothetical protein
MKIPWDEKEKEIHRQAQFEIVCHPALVVTEGANREIWKDVEGTKTVSTERRLTPAGSRDRLKPFIVMRIC